MDTLFIRQLKTSVLIGHLPEERHAPQPIWFDLDIDTDIKVAGNSDLLSHALDYSVVCARLKDYVQSTSFELIEALAEHAAAFLLREFSIEHLRLTVKKQPADMPDIDCVGITIER